MSGEKEATGEDRAVRIGRVLDSFLSRREAGELVSEAELCTRHPDIALELRMHLDLLGDLPPAVDKINTLIAKGLLARSEDPKYQAQLGAYKIHDYIGRGGMGIVLKAYEESLNRTVALKILRPELADDHVALERFTREAKAAGALRHPNIVTVHAISHERGVPFIAMEYVEGPSLAEVIRSVGSPCPTNAASSVGSPCPTDLEDELDAGRAADFSPRGADLPETNDTARAEARGSSLLLSSSHSSSGSRFPFTTDTIRHIFGQLLEALAAAHDAGLIHRDVKSSNILLTSSSSVPQQPGAAVPHDPKPRTLNPEPSNRTLNPEPFIKLADFGLARMLNSQTRMTAADSILGTPEYMSPEQARGDSEIDHRTALYSAGVVLYEMLTGRVPFKADTPSAIIHQILNTDPPEPRTFNQDVDPVLASLAIRMMAKRPRDRFASAKGPIAALLAGDRVAPPRGDWWRKLLKRATAVAAPVAILAAMWLWQRASEQPKPDLNGHTPAPRIVNVWVKHPDLSNIWAEYADATKKVFYEFPEEVRRVSDVAIADFYGDGRQFIVAGLSTPLDGNNIFVIDARGERLWGLDISDYSSVEWPDEIPRAQWTCRFVRAAPMDEEPGDEIVIAANHDNYSPARLAIINPRDRRIQSTMWHFGHFADVKVVQGFFGAKLPAIVAWTYSHVPGKHFTVMIVDPMKMSKEPDDSVLRTGVRVGAVPDSAHAYAYLESPPARDIRTVDHPASNEVISRPAGTPRILKVELSLLDSDPSTAPWFNVYVEYLSERGAVLVIDRNLTVQHVILADTERPLTDESFWKAHWNVVTSQ